jgi:D-cysteine desulfhydrase
VQSNHCRATVAVATRLGMSAVVLLRSTEPSAPLPLIGNAFLMKLLGADIRIVSPAEYADRTAKMAAVAAELQARGRRPYVIPEGGSNGLGSLGYVVAMGEVRDQLDAGQGGAERFDVIVHACGSGGTAAGVALGAARFGVASKVVAVAVCDSRAYFERVTDRIMAESRALEPDVLVPPVSLDCDDRWKGPAYGVASDEQRRFVVDMARRHGLVLDPVYTGKALFGLASAVRADGLAGQRVLFLHTGGLPGLLGAASELDL